MSHEETLKDIITKDLGWDGNTSTLTPDYDLIENEVIDSLGLTKLVGLVESRFGVVISDEQLVPENFATIRALSELIDSAPSH